MNSEPAAIIAAIAAFANAAVGCIVAFGIDWSQEQQYAILGVEAATTALNAIAEVPPGKTVPVKVVRRNQELTLEVVVGKRKPKPKAPEE